MTDWRADLIGTAEAIVRAGDRVNAEARIQVEVISDLAKRLIETIEGLKRETEELRRMLANPPDNPEATRPGAASVSGGLRLLATQMKIAGHSREEIKARLREEFGVDDVEAALAGGLDDATAGELRRQGRRAVPPPGPGASQGSR